MTVQRGEIYFVDLDPVRGREQAGVRPAVVLSVDLLIRLPLVVTVVPGTDGANVRRNFPSTVRVSPAESGLPLETVFLCFQVRAIDLSRFAAQPAGRLGVNAMARIENSIRYCLGV
ncbi:MAG TPA: type II toxin-antitoxin system PemK/MazF family toxin [Gemmataceae bacterium]|nr:type II toxin-antitoxin system PemK/MazF family toxin [Gemmataceae bacterium]